MNIYFPFEGKARELHARILFSIEAAKRGHKAFFGHKTDIYPIIKKLKPGLYFHKSIQKRKIKQIELLKKLGHFNAAIDEEGLVNLHEDVYFGYRITRKNLKAIDVFFTWGEKQKLMIMDKYPELEKKLIPAGNSRVDLLKNESIFLDKASKIKAKYPDFILFATKFVNSNFVRRKKGESSYVGMKKLNQPDLSKKTIKELTDMGHWDEKNRELFMDAIKDCALAFPDKMMIIRPHPAEEMETWKTFIKSIGLKNIVCEKATDSIIPWTLACTKLVSHNCTTLLDASLLNKKGVNYIPLANKNFEYFVFYHCSTLVRDPITLINLLKQEKNEDDYNKEMEKYVTNWSETSFCENALSFIEKNVLHGKYSIQNKKTNQFFLFLNKLFNKIKKFYSLYLGKGRKRRKIFQQKFPGVTLKEVKDIFDKFNQSKKLKISENWPGVFCIESK